MSLVIVIIVIIIIVIIQFKAYNGLLQSAPAVVFTIFAGPLSDSYGRYINQDYDDDRQRKYDACRRPQQDNHSHPLYAGNH